MVRASLLPPLRPLLFGLLLAAAIVKSTHVCLYVRGKVEKGDRYEGGLANSVACVNAILHVSVKYNVSFVFPVLRPVAHHLGFTFGDFFVDLRDPEHTEPTVSWREFGMPSCCSRPLAIRPVTMKVPAFKRGSKMTISGKPNREFVAFVSSHATSGVVFPEESDQADALGCDVLVSYPQRGPRSDHDFDYSQTGDIIRGRYFRNGIEPPSYVNEFFEETSKRIKVVIHHRLGDVVGISRGPWAEKRLRASWPLAMMKLLSLLIEPRCLDLILCSEGRSTSPELSFIINYLGDALPVRRPDPSSLSFEAKTALENKTGHHGTKSERLDFELMVHANVLIAATSGFSRLAALLSPHASITIDSTSHPLRGEKDVLNLESDPFLWDLDQSEMVLNRTGWTQDSYVAHSLELMLEQNPELFEQTLELLRNTQDAKVMQQCVRKQPPSKAFAEFYQKAAAEHKTRFGRPLYTTDS